MFRVCVRLLYANMDNDDKDAPICQTCLSPSERRCSKCGVCQFCSEKCEREADARCRAHIACAQHLKRTHDDVNIGRSAAHFVMLEMLSLSHVPSCHKQTQWQTLVYGAMQYLRFLIASSSQTVCKKTAFGMSLVVTQDNQFSAGRQRLNYLDGKQSDAAAMIVRNMSELALAQLKATHTPKAPLKSHSKKKKTHHNDNDNDNDDHKHRDFAEDTSNQACIVSGLVVKEGVHFDAIFLIRKGDTWTIHGVQPLWLQELTFCSHNRYKMPFAMEGHPPAKSRHSIALLQNALSPAPAPAPAPAPTQAPTQAPPRPRSPVEMPPPSEPPPPLRLPPALAARLNLPPDEEVDLPTLSESLDELQLPPHLVQALKESEASEEAPPWTRQLQEALRLGAPGPPPP